MKIPIIMLFVFVSIPFVVMAHPGNTSSDGGHYCWTNCSSWGEVYGQRHFHGGGYAPSYNYTPTYSYPATSSCPANSYSSGSSCKCNYGYVVDGGKCVSGDSYCTGEIGLMSTYNSLNNSCECMSGYEIGMSGQCSYKSKSTSNTSYGGYTYNSSLNSCPKNSSQSLTDYDSCTCNVGYQVNSKKDKCVKVPKKTNDKMCQSTYGKKSEWNGKYNDDNGLPYCECKKKYEWNEKGTSCMKEK